MLDFIKEYSNINIIIRSLNYGLFDIFLIDWTHRLTDTDRQSIIPTDKHTDRHRDKHADRHTDKHLLRISNILTINYINCFSNELILPINEQSDIAYEHTDSSNEQSDRTHKPSDNPSEHTDNPIEALSSEHTYEQTITDISQITHKHITPKLTKLILNINGIIALNSNDKIIISDEITPEINEGTYCLSFSTYLTLKTNNPNHINFHNNNIYNNTNYITLFSKSSLNLATNFNNNNNNNNENNNNNNNKKKDFSVSVFIIPKRLQQSYNQLTVRVTTEQTDDTG